MSGITALLTSKKSSLALIAMLVITLVDPTVAGWLPNLNETHIVCLTVIVCVAIVMQGAIDITETVTGRTRPEPPK